jgi:hypothetical protein
LDILDIKPIGEFNDNNLSLRCCLVNIYKNILQFKDKDFTWEYASIPSVVLKIFHNQHLFLDTVAGTFPGATTSQTITNRINKFVNNVFGGLSTDPSICPNSDIIIFYDNVPGLFIKTINKVIIAGMVGCIFNLYYLLNIK